MPDPPAGPEPAPLTVRDLARMVLDLLDRQASYFKWKDAHALEQCKGAEAAMRKTCKGILNPPPQKGLFDRC